MFTVKRKPVKIITSIKHHSLVIESLLPVVCDEELAIDVVGVSVVAVQQR